MDKIKEQITKCLGALSSIPAVREELKETPEAVTQFEEALSTGVADLCASSSFITPEMIEALVAGEEPVKVKITQTELFIACQDEAMNVSDKEWTESTVKLALASYLSKGGVLEPSEAEGEVLVTIGELFGLDSEDLAFAKESKLNTRSRNNLPEAVFCGPNRSFPVHDKEHAVAALKLIERYTGAGDKSEIRNNILAKAKKFGVNAGESADSLFYTPIFITVVKDGASENYPAANITDKAQAETMLENISALTEKYHLTTENTEALTVFLTDLIENSEFYFTTGESVPLLNNEKELPSPLCLSNEFLLEYFLRHENNKETNTLLAQIVGLVRKEGISLERIEAAGKPYSIFGTTVLQKLLTTPIKADTSENVPNTGAEDGAEKVGTIDNPVVGESADDSGKLETKTVIAESNKPWYQGQFSTRRQNQTKAKNGDK